MKLIETQSAMASANPVDRNDPDAIRAQFVGAPPAEYDTKHSDYEPSGELMSGEYGSARPAERGNPGGCGILPLIENFL